MLRSVLLGGVLALAAASCGSDGDDAAAPATTPSPDASAAPEATAASTTAAPETRSSTVSVPLIAPAPPVVPRDFTWTGRYLVPDLDLEVPFTWHGADGDFQMVAGGEDHPIHFTNLVVDGELYTLTYEWPGVPRNPCSLVGAFTVDDLNEGLATAAFVGRETLHDTESREVNHFRSTSVWDLPPELIAPIPGVPQLRIPLMSGDIYTDVDDPSTFWKVLQFGVQNLYDAQLDEWMVIDVAEPVPGEVVLPEECRM